MKLKGEYFKVFDSQDATCDFDLIHNQYVLELAGINSLYWKYQFNILPDFLRVKIIISIEWNTMTSSLKTGYGKITPRNNWYDLSKYAIHRYSFTRFGKKNQRSLRINRNASFLSSWTWILPIQLMSDIFTGKDW